MTDAARRDRLIVALDLPHAVAGLDMAERLGDTVGFYKMCAACRNSGMIS